MTFPPNFVANITAADGEAGLQWLRQIENTLRELRDQWSIQEIVAVSNLTFNFVGLTKITSTGQKAVLKMSPPTRPVLPEVSWLNAYSGLTPAILKVDESKNAFLMELCEPGNLLKDLLQKNDESATRALSQVIKQLRQKNVSDESFKHIADLIPDLQALSGFADRHLHSKAESLFKDLTKDRSQDILLHADLHHENILKHKDGWRVIDPHGYRGDPVAETGVMIYNPIGTLPTGGELVRFIDRRIHILAEELGDDPQKIKAWCFCKTMLSAAWNVPDFKDLARREIEIARAIEKAT